MAVTLETLTLDRLQAQPLGYAESDTTAGLASRRWNVRGLLLPAEWVNLLGIFDSWRAARVADPDTLTSLSVGTTVTFSGRAAGVSWSNVECWFTGAPEGEASGAYINASFELVDAQQALAVLIRGQERDTESADSECAIHGTYVINGATIYLSENPDGYGWGPQGERTAAGYLVLNGPVGVIKAKTLNGHTTEAGWTNIQSWYEAIALTQPVSNSWYPVKPPQMSRRCVLVGGVMQIRCEVDLELWRVP